MKTPIVIMSFLFTSIFVSAQDIKYSIELNNPDAYPKLSINSDLLQLDISGRNINGMTVNLGLWGYYEMLYGKAGINFLARRSLISFGKMDNENYPNTWELDAGGYIILRSRSKTKKTRIVLKSSESTNTMGQRVTNTTYIMVPTTHKIMSGVRGGLYHKSGPMTFESDESGIDLETAMNTQALYAGLFTRRLHHVIIRTDQYGRKFSSIGTEFYADGMLFFHTGFTSVTSDLRNAPAGGVNVKDTVQSSVSQGIMGFRVGYRMYQIAPQSETGKRFGMSATFELGYRPYQGVFVNAGIGLTFIKRKP